MLPRNPRWSLRTLAITMTAVLLVPTIGLAALMVIRLAQDQRRLDEVRDLGLARALSSRIDSKLATMQAALLALGTVRELREQDYAGFYRQARIVAAQNRAEIVLADPEGHQLLDTDLPFGAALPALTDRELAATAAATGDMQVSDLFDTLASRRPAVAVYVPVAAQPRLVLAMAIGPDALSGILAAQPVPPRWTTTLFDRGQRIIGRNHQLDRFLGRLAAPEFRRAVTRGEGPAVLPTAEGGNAYTVFARSAVSGWTVAFAIPCREVDAPLRATLIEVGFGGGLLALAAVAVALAATRRLRRSMANLSRAAAALGGGDVLPECAGSVLEIDAVIAAMRDAAKALRGRAAERDQAEAALRESEQRLRDFAVLSPDSFWEHDAELRFSWISQSPDHPADETHATLGKTRWEWAGADLSEPHWAAHRADLFAHRPFRGFRYERATADGKVRHLRTSGTPIFDAFGGFRGYRGTLVDETEIVEARRRAERAEALLRDAIDSMSEGFVIYDRDDRLVVFNEPSAEIYGLRPDELAPGMTFDQTLQIGLAKGAYTDAIGREAAWLAERRRVHHEPAGGVEQQLTNGRWVLVTERRMRNGGIAGLRIDITALRAAQEELRQSEQRLNQAQRIAHLGSGVRDLRSDTAVWSDEVYRILGVTRDAFEPTTANVLKLVHPDDRAAILATRTIGDAEMRPFEFRIIRPDGVLRQLRREFELIRDAAGAPLYLSGTVQDVTELREAQEREKALERQLLHSQKLEALGTLAGGIAHDLNKALVPVLAMTEAVRGELPADSPHREALDLAVDGSRRAKALVQQILAFSRNQAAVEVEFDPNPVVSQSLRMLRATIPSTIVLRVETEPVPPLVGDPGQLHQMLVNLVTNAEQAVGERGTITARMHPEGDGSQIRISVADTGCGMDRVTRERIFEPFFTTKAVGQGTGLGLSIVYRIVANLGGSITVDSEPNKGTRFDILLPIARCSRAAAA